MHPASSEDATWRKHDSCRNGYIYSTAWFPELDPWKMLLQTSDHAFSKLLCSPRSWSTGKLWNSIIYSIIILLQSFWVWRIWKTPPFQAQWPASLFSWVSNLLKVFDVPDTFRKPVLRRNILWTRKEKSWILYFTSHMK